MPISTSLWLNWLKLQTMLTKNKINFFYTVLICINHFTYGITTNIIGAALVDLRFIYSVSLNEISYVPVATGIGYLLGSLASYLYKYFNRQLMLIGFSLLMAITVAFIPFYGILLVALPALVANGIGSGAWDSATSIWLVDMNPIGNAALLQASQCMYGLGSIIAPMLASPFLYGEANVTADNRTLTVEDRIRALTYPFAIVGVAQTIVPIIFFILYFTHRYEKPRHSTLKNEDDDEESNPGSIQEQNPLPRSAIPARRTKLLLCGLCLAAYGTVEIGHFSFSSALFQHLPIHLTAATSAHLLGILSTTYTLGRLASAFISIKLQPDTIISYHYILLVSGVSVLYWGRDDLWYITVGTALLGYAFSAMWAAVFAFAERHLRLTDRVCSLFSFLCGTVSLAIPLVLGQSFKANPLILFYLEFAFIGASAILFGIVKTWIETDRKGPGRRRMTAAVEAHSHVY